MTFGYLRTLLAICVEQLILCHAYNEYLVLVIKHIYLYLSHGL
jgi:hypothetical protein